MRCRRIGHALHGVTVVIAVGGIFEDDYAVAVFRPVGVVDEERVHFARHAYLEVLVTAVEGMFAHDNLLGREGDIVVGHTDGDILHQVDVLQVLASRKRAVGQQDAYLGVVVGARLVTQVGEVHPLDVFIAAERGGRHGNGLIHIRQTDVVDDSQVSVVILQIGGVGGGYLRVCHLHDRLAVVVVGEDVAPLKLAISLLQPQVVAAEVGVALVAVVGAVVLRLAVAVHQHGEVLIHHAEVGIGVVALHVGHNLALVLRPVGVGLVGVDQFGRHADEHVLRGVEQFLGGYDLLGAQILDVVGARVFMINHIDAQQVAASLECAALYEQLQWQMCIAHIGVDVAEVDGGDKLVALEGGGVDAHRAVVVVAAYVVIYGDGAVAVHEVVLVNGGDVGVIVVVVHRVLELLPIHLHIVVGVLLQLLHQLGVVSLLAAAHVLIVHRVVALGAAHGVALVGHSVLTHVFASHGCPGDDALAVSRPFRVFLEPVNQVGPYADVGILAAADQRLVVGSDGIGRECLVGIRVGVAIHEVDVSQ